MNKLASFVNHYRSLGSQLAVSQQQSGLEKTAFLGKLLPKSRLGKLGLGAAGLVGGTAAMKAMQPEPSMMENLYEGGKDALSNMSEEDVVRYGNLLSQMYNDPSSLMGYDAQGAGSIDPSMYTMTDMGYYPDASSSMGYEAAMSPEEAQAYLQYYS